MHVRMFTSLEVNVEEELKRYKEYADKLRPLVIETVSYIHNELKKGKRILVEGANAAMLDIDFGKPWSLDEGTRRIWELIASLL